MKVFRGGLAPSAFRRVEAMIETALDALEDSPLLLASHTLVTYCLDGLACRTVAAAPAARNLVRLTVWLQVGESLTADDVRAFLIALLVDWVMTNEGTKVDPPP